MFSAGAKEVRERAAKGLSAPTTLRDIRVLSEQFTNQALRDARGLSGLIGARLPGRGLAFPRRCMKGRTSGRCTSGDSGRSRGSGFTNRAVRRRGVPPTRLVRYPEIDRGRTRFE